jgi:hypothetical protein
VVPSQQPAGHAVPSQTQPPETQCLPVAQGAALPHRQAPPDEQVSAATSSHATHACAPVPHAAADGGELQVAPEQQPFAQFEELQPLQTPALQVPGEQSEQAPPPVPQAEVAVPGRQAVPEQQPVQEAGSQTHSPPEQRCPVPQAAFAPHWHTPVDEQPSATEVSHAWHVAPPAPQ